LQVFFSIFSKIFLKILFGFPVDKQIRPVLLFISAY